MSENPSANRCLEDPAIDHVDHALGRPIFPLRESYRNYFATEVGGKTAGEFERSPFWELGGLQGRMAYFHVTDAGRLALARYLAEIGSEWRPYVVSYRRFERTVPARSPAKAKYSYFLDLRDIAPDLAFVDFASECRVRLAA